MTTAYLAAEGFTEQLLGDLRHVEAVHGRLVVAHGKPQIAPWAQNVWLEPRPYKVKSIKDAAKTLRAMQRSWWPYATQLHRRTELIQAELPHVSAKPLPFPAPPPAHPLGAWMLLDDHTMLASPRCSSPFPNGEPSFTEFKEGPPSRAYLKLFEALTRLGKMPGPGERCLELGASPGGWTWVLARLGPTIVTFDRAPLDPAVAAMPGVEHHLGDAFQAKPETIGPIDWLFSDIICYPEKLYEFVRLWLDAGLCKNFVCTLKFQGSEHYGVIPQFLAIPGAQVFHMAYNKHELTFALTAP